MCVSNGTWVSNCGTINVREMPKPLTYIDKKVDHATPHEIFELLDQSKWTRSYYGSIVKYIDLVKTGHKPSSVQVCLPRRGWIRQVINLLKGYSHDELLAPIGDLRTKKKEWIRDLRAKISGRKKAKDERKRLKQEAEQREKQRLEEEQRKEQLASQLKEMQIRETMVKRYCDMLTELTIVNPIAVKGGGFFITKPGRNPLAVILDIVGQHGLKDHVPRKISFARLRGFVALDKTIDGMSNYDLLVLAGDVELNPGPKGKNNRSNRNRPKNKKKRANKKVNHGNDEFKMIPRNIQKSHEIVEMVFDLSSSPFNNPGGNIVSEIFNQDDGYDWLPSILTPTMQFLNRQFTIYGKAKIISTEFTFVFTNLEQVEIDLNFFSAPKAISSIAGSRSAIEEASATGIYRGGTVMSEQYGKNSKVMFRDKVKTGNIVGNKLRFKATEDFAFTQSSGPAVTTYYGWFASSPLSTMATGVTRRVRIVARVYFYEALTLTAAVMAAKPPGWVCPRSNRDRLSLVRATPL